MASQKPVEDRDALYYPYIHIRNETWLRNALLFFPHVRRMTPPEFALNDSKFIAELAKTEGRWGDKLVGSYKLNSPPAFNAGTRLATRFGPDVADPSFRAKYGRSETVRQFGNDSIFQIHKDKFAEVLVNTLEKAGLAWKPKQPHRGRWFAVHPVIGEIMMSTAAAAAAEDEGFDILTDTDRNHIVTSSRDEQTIYNTLLGRAEDRLTARKPTEAEIGELVIATTFDLSALKPADFAELAKEHEALFDLRALLAERAGNIPPMSNRATREKRAREAAELIVDEWEAKKRTWGGFVRKLFRLEGAAEAKSVATDLLKLAMPGVAGAGAGAVAGAAATGAVALGPTLLAAVPGLAVGFSFYGLKTWNDLGAAEKSGPARFLSRVVEHGGVLAASSSPSRC